MAIKYVGRLEGQDDRCDGSTYVEGESVYETTITIGLMCETAGTAYESTIIIVLSCDEAFTSTETTKNIVSTHQAAVMKLETIKNIVSGREVSRIETRDDK